uniref:KIAA1549 like n=1 Tax=Bubo bubo TaxID=30461 RepID=A0A8C0FX87_BUBBB
MSCCTFHCFLWVFLTLSEFLCTTTPLLFGEEYTNFIYYFTGIRQQHINVAPSTGSFPNWRSRLSPTRPSTEAKTPSVSDISMGQTLENANLLQMIKTTLTGTRTRTLDQTHLSPTIYQGSGNSASQEPAEVSAESPLRSSSQDADETAAVSGLLQLGMFATLSTTPSVTHLSTDVPFQLIPLETPSISKESTSGSDMLAAVPSASLSSLVIQSPHTINFSKPAVLPIKVPLSADPEGFFNTDSASSQVSESRNSPLSMVTVVHSSMVNHRKGPKLFTGTLPFKLSGSTTVHFTEIVGKGSPSERTSFLSVYSDIPVSKAYRSSLPGTSRSLSRFPTESTYTLSSTGVKPVSELFKAMLTDRNSNITPLSSVFWDKAEVPTSVFHPVGTPHLILQMSHPQSSTALTNCTTSAPFMSSAPESLAEVSSSTESTPSLSLPKSFIPDARHAHNAVLPVRAFRSETDFLFRNATHSSSTSARSPLLTETNDTFTRIARRNSPSAAAADEDTLQIPLTVSSQHSVAQNQTFAEDLTDGAYQASGMRLPTVSAHTLPISDGFPVARIAQQPSTRGVTAKLSMNFNANSVLPYGSQLSKVFPDIKTRKLLKGSKILGSVLETAMTSPDLAAGPLITSTTGLLKPESAITNTSASNIFVTAYLPPGDAESPDVTAGEDRNTRVSTVVTSHAEYSPLRALNHFTSHQTSHSVDRKPLASVVPPAWGMLPSFISMTTVMDSPSSSFSGISNVDSESNLDPVSSPEVAASASMWTNTALLSSADVSIPSVKTSVKTAIREVPPSISALETNYHAPYSVASSLQKKINTNKQPIFSTPSANYMYANSGQNVSNSPFAGIKSNSFPEFSIDAFALKTSPVQYSSLATTLTVPDPLQKKHGSAAESIANFFTVGDINASTHHEAPLRLHAPSVNDTGASPSSLESQTTDAGKITLLTKTLGTTPMLAFQLTDTLTLSSSNEDSAIHGMLPAGSPSPVTKPSSSTILHSFVIEDGIGSGYLAEFADNHLESSGFLVVADKNPATFSVEEWDTSATRHSLVPSNISNKATKGIPLQTPTTSALQSVIITSVHASPTQLTSPFLSTTNFTHSVITVLSGVSSGAIPTVGTSEAKPLTRKSSPASPVPASSFFSLGTENTPLPSVMALSTPILTLTKNNTATKLTSDLISVGTHTDFPFATRNTTASPVDVTAMLITPKSSMVTASTLAPTAHVPRQIETAVTDTQKFPSSEITKTSTPYPLTITAALTSITASAKTTRLPPTPVENTSAPPETTVAAAFANMTAAPPLDCRLSRNLMVKTVLFLNTRRMLISNAFRESVRKGLNQVLRQAFNQNVSAQVEILEQSTNVTVGYYVTRGRLVFMPAAVIERLLAYGISNATADIKQHVPHLQSVVALALPWKPLPAYHLQLKTELQFVGQTDNIQSCKFVQTMEQRLQRAFQDAERKVLNTSNNLTVQILNTSNVSQAVTLFYVVNNQSTTLNGTISSNLLNQLSAELVGFYLTYPPLTIAESLEYPNLDVSESTRDYWVITVIQGVDIALLGLNNQSFARLMEQRLAPLFMMSHQQGRRFKRATTVGSYTVQMVKIQRIPGPKEPAELTYYTLYNGKPLLGTAAAKILSTVDSQRMALTLGYVIQVQADPVVKNPPNNLWIIAAVLAPIAVVMVIIIIITAVLCRKNKNDFKPDTMMNLPQRAKPVQGFDYAKQHLGQQGAEDEVLPVTQETVVLPLPVRDAPASQEREITQDGSTIKTAKSNETRKSRSPSQNGSIISNGSGKPSSGRSSLQKVMAPQKVTKDDGRKRNVPVSDEEEGGILFDNIAKSAIDPFDTSSGSVQLIAIKPVALPAVHAASDRSQESAIINGEVNKALKQKSDIEHYRNKLRLKAKRKGYYDFPQVDNKGLTERKRMYEKNQKELDHILDPDADISSPFAEPKNRQPMKNSVYRSRQSLNSPSPGETEMDLLVTRERPRRGIRNSGYDTEPEIIEETNVDRVNEPRSYTRSRQAKGHSETSTLSSQPSIDEVRQQMHMLLEEAFSLASAGHGGQSRQEAYSSAPHLPYSEVVTSAPGTMTRPRGGVQWVPTYRPEMYQYSLPRPAYRFSQLPEMVMGSPPPPVPPRTGPVAVASLRRSTSDIGSKVRIPESSGADQAQHHDQASFAPGSRAPMSVGPLDQSAFHSGNTVPAVFAIPAANRPGFTGYFIPTPPTAYRNQAWMPYAGENELPGQWADSVPLPGYIEAYPRSRYQHSSPSRLPRQYSQQASMHPSLEQAPLPSTAASQQSLTENDPSDAPLTNISTAALVKAIREEVAKLAKKQTDMFEFQV